MKSNTKITALEVLQEVAQSFVLEGVAVAPQDVFGKYSVRIGGIPVNKADKIIVVQPEVNTLEVVVGMQKFTIDTTLVNDNRLITPAVQELKIVKGEDSTKKAEELQLIKKPALRVYRARLENKPFALTDEEKLNQTEIMAMVESWELGDKVDVVREKIALNQELNADELALKEEFGL